MSHQTPLVNFPLRCKPRAKGSPSKPHPGSSTDVESWERRMRTEHVDVNSRGKPCRERMLVELFRRTGSIRSTLGRTFDYQEAGLAFLSSSRNRFGASGSTNFQRRNKPQASGSPATPEPRVTPNHSGAYLGSDPRSFSWRNGLRLEEAELEVEGTAAEFFI